MITKFTTSQKLLIPKIKEKWIAFAESGEDVDKERCTPLIEWVYRLSNLKKPKVFYAKSPMGAQIIANIIVSAGVSDGIQDSVKTGVEAGLRDCVWDCVNDDVKTGVEAGLRDCVWDCVLDCVWDSVEDSVGLGVRAGVGLGLRDCVWDGVKDGVGADVSADVSAGIRDTVKAGVWDIVWESVRSGLSAGVWESVKDGVDDSVCKLKYFEFSYYVNFSDLGWVSFYDFFDNAGILEKVCSAENLNKIRKFRDLIQCGVYDIIALDGACIVVEPPKILKRDSAGRRHSLSGNCLEWSDGWGINEIHGVYFKTEEFKKFTRGEMTAEDIIKEENQDRKRVMAMTYGNEKLIKELNAIECSREKDNQGNDMVLYKIDLSQDEKMIIYQGVCPSKGEVIYLRVPDEFENKRPIEAKIWTFQPLWEEYQKTGIIPEFIAEA